MRRIEMLLSILPGRDTVDIFESTGEMQLIGITNHCADFADGHLAFFEQLLCFRHTVNHQEFLGRRAHGIAENAAEITAIQTAGVGDVFDGNIQVVVLFNE